MRGRRRSGWQALLALAAVIGCGLQPAGAVETGIGEWVPWFSEDPSLSYPAAAPQDERAVEHLPTAVSIAVLPDGNVVYWNGFQDTENMDGPVPLAIPPDQTSKSRHLNLAGYLATGDAGALVWSTPTPEDGGGGDMFCADVRMLADGRVFVAGGTSWVNETEGTIPATPLGHLGRTELYGLKATRTYRPGPHGGTWTQQADMTWRRWYPSMVTLGDGRMMVAGGVERLVYNSTLVPGDAPGGGPLPINVRESEIYDPAADAWTPNGDSQSFPLFPRLHLMPDGKVLYDSSGQPWSPFGQDRDQHTWGTIRLFDPQTKTWQAPPVDGTTAAVGHRGTPSSVMLPLQPPYERAQILLAGGTLLPSPGSGVVTPLSEIVTVTADGVQREAGPLMNHARWMGSGVVLPTGEVIVINGADRDHASALGIDRAVRETEMFDGERWVELASSARERTYHNTAILLKDGSILVGGHAPISGKDHSTAPGHANNFKDPTFEIFKAPYLFRGTRPTITGGVPSSATYGSAMTVSFATDTAPEAGTDTTIVLSRLPGTTHGQDADQRTVVLPTQALHDGVSGGAITVRVPTNRNVVPPGHYYAFVVRTNDDQTKPTASVGRIVRIG